MTNPENLPARPQDVESGLEDFAPSRMVIPRLTIDHKTGALVDNLTEQQYVGGLKVVMLGMVLQRILWHVQPGDKGELPLCKSPDAEHGFPTPDDKLPKDKMFPWSGEVTAKGVAADSGFRREDFPAEDGINGLVTLSCANCALAKWESHPAGRKPYCSEMYTFPVMFSPGGDEDMLVPALFSVRSTGIKPANSYLTSFASTKTPMYTVWTRIGLNIVTRSGNEFAVPSFSKAEATDRELWPEFSQTYRGIRETIRRAPTPMDDDSEDAGVSVPVTPPAATPSPAARPVPSTPPAAPRPAAVPAPAAAPAPQAVAEATPDDDDLPF